MTCAVDETKQKLIEVTIERDTLKKEKEEQLALLNDKLTTMEKSYESILQVLFSTQNKAYKEGTCKIFYLLKQSTEGHMFHECHKFNFFIVSFSRITGLML